MRTDLADERNVFFFSFVSVLFLTVIQRATVKTGEDVDDSCPKISFTT